jgi:hypothetical protein
MKFNLFNKIFSYFFLIFVISCQSYSVDENLISTEAPADNSRRPTEVIHYETYEEQNSLPNKWDGGLLSSIPCNAPCFAGITPGLTTELQVMEIIKDNDYFQECELKDVRNQGRWISCKGLIININTDSQIVEGIGFMLLNNITLEEVVAKFGEPTTAWVAPDGIPEFPYIVMILLFENTGVRVDIERQEDIDGYYLLKPSDLITNIVYYIEENGGLGGYLQPWHGYGEYVIDSDWD